MLLMCGNTGLLFNAKSWTSLGRLDTGLKILFGCYNFDMIMIIVGWCLHLFRRVRRHFIWWRMLKVYHLGVWEDDILILGINMCIPCSGDTVFNVIAD